MIHAFLLITFQAETVYSRLAAHLLALNWEAWGGEKGKLLLCILSGQQLAGCISSRLKASARNCCWWWSCCHGRRLRGCRFNPEYFRCNYAASACVKCHTNSRNTGFYSALVARLFFKKRKQKKTLLSLSFGKKTCWAGLHKAFIIPVTVTCAKIHVVIGSLANLLCKTILSLFIALL